VEEQLDIFGLVRTIESATYIKLGLTTGNMNLGGMGIISTLGQGGGCMCHCNQVKDGDGDSNSRPQAKYMHAAT
jgi:hypothetical protein